MWNTSLSGQTLTWDPYNPSPLLSGPALPNILNLLYVWYLLGW